MDRYDVLIVGAQATLMLRQQKFEGTVALLEPEPPYDGSAGGCHAIAAGGHAYAVWTGLGAVGVAVMGTVLLGERLNAVQMGFIALIIVGVGGTKFFATT